MDKDNLLCPWCFNEPRLTKIEGSLTNPELVACETGHCPLDGVAMTPEQWNQRTARHREFDYAVTLQESLEPLREALEPFAAMDREECNLDEVACVRGTGFDKTAITSEDFRRAALVLVNGDTKDGQHGK